MAYTLTADEVSALVDFKSHCEHTIENIDRLLDANGTGDIYHTKNTLRNVPTL